MKQRLTSSGREASPRRRRRRVRSATVPPLTVEEAAPLRNEGKLPGKPYDDEEMAELRAGWNFME